jgi:hypothetical protein
MPATPLRLLGSISLLAVGRTSLADRFPAGDAADTTDRATDGAADRSAAGGLT